MTPLKQSTPETFIIILASLIELETFGGIAVLRHFIMFKMLMLKTVLDMLNYNHPLSITLWVGLQLSGSDGIIERDRPLCLVSMKAYF